LQEAVEDFGWPFLDGLDMDRGVELSTGFVWQSRCALLWSSESPKQNRVLVVDDDVNLTRLVRTILHTGGFEVLSSDDAELALSVAERERPDVIILDLRMPRMDGRTFFRELRSRGIATPVLISSAFGARSAQIELGAEASIEKPFDPERLIEAVSELLPES
jgi:DNA-binding response OmpR family regulator